MIATMAKDIDREQHERFLLNKIEDLRSIVTGLENHAPFLKLIEMWKETRDRIDDNWHFITDPVKMNEARITKFAANDLINIIDIMKSDLSRAEIELYKLQHPDEHIQKDYET